MRKAEWMPFTLPAILFLVLAGILPLLASLKMGFYQEVKGETVFVGLKHYGWVLQHKPFWSATGHSFFFSGFTVLGHLLIGLGFALLLNRKIKHLSFWRGLQFTPWLFPPAAVSCLWILIYQDQYGLLNSMLRFLSLSDWTTNWLGTPGTALTAVTIASIWNWYPFLTLTLLAGMQNIPGELYEAIEIDGGGSWSKFWFITIPHLMPVILTICLLDFLWTFRFFDMAWIMTHGGPAKSSEVLATYVYKLAFHTYRFDRAAAVGGLIVIFMGVFTILYLLAYRRLEENK
jgi:multiple sugar transport system permease protein